jgi:hypothetical protein
MKKEGGWEGAKVRNRSRTVSIRVSFTFAVVFDFNLFPVSTSKAQFIFYRQCPLEKAKRGSWVHGFNLFFNAHCLLTH